MSTQAADPPHVAVEISFAAKMMNLQLQSDIERFDCPLFADWKRTSGLLQYNPQPLNINYPASGGRVNVTHRVGGCVCVLGGVGGCSRRNNQPNHFELSPCNNPHGASTLAPVPKTAA